MGNCASARTRPTAKEAQLDEKFSAAITTLAAQEAEIHHLRRQLDASTAYAQGVCHEASVLRERIWDLEERPPDATRTLPDGMLVRSLVQLPRKEDAAAIRCALYEFLMWERDDGVLERRGEQRKRSAEVVDEARLEGGVVVEVDEDGRGLDVVHDRLLGNIEAIKNGTWTHRGNREDGTREHQRRMPGLVVPPPPPPTSCHIVTTCEALETSRSATAETRRIPGTPPPAPVQTPDISLREALHHKTEALAIQERLVQSLMRERDDLRAECARPQRSKNPVPSPRQQQQQQQHDDSDPPPGSPEWREANSPYFGHNNNNAFPSFAASARRLPTDSAVDIMHECLDCADLRAEIWGLARRLEEERAKQGRVDR